MIPFLKSIFIFAIAIALLLLVLTLTNFGVYISTVTWVILAYFVLLTAGFHFGLTLSSKGNPQQFVHYHMGATSFKLLIHVIVLIGYCLFHKNDAVRFIITFALFYFVFTVFEFTVIRRSFRK